MKFKLLATMLLAGSSLFAGSHFSIGIGIGGYYPAGGYYAAAPLPPPPVYYEPAPAYYYAPAPSYVWVPGYYYPRGHRWERRAGYWARPPYRGARWHTPRYSSGHFYAGYWR